MIDVDDIPTCFRCKKAMRLNVPRLGPSGGYVHADTGKILCSCPFCGHPERSALGTHCAGCLSELPPDYQTWRPQGSWMGGEGGDA